MFVGVVHGPDPGASAYIEDVLDISSRVIRGCEAQIIVESSKKEGML
jgi:hypothetical protein